MKKGLLLSLLLGLGLGLIAYHHFFSLREFNVVLTGHTADAINPLMNVKVALAKSYEPENAFQYAQESSKTGGYRLQFNAKEAIPVKLQYTKSGFFKLCMNYTPIPNKGAKENDRIYGKMEIASLFNKRRYKTPLFRGSFNNKQLLLFDTMDAKLVPDTFNLNDIDFFTKAKKKAPFDAIQLTNDQPFIGHWYHVKFFENDIEQEGYILYEAINIVRP